jgi:hypothetical protein
LAVYKHEKECDSFTSSSSEQRSSSSFFYIEKNNHAEEIKQSRFL